ncbi:MAG: hypothetical protein JSS00_10950 [Proteobacteria bacterium]|nr:hypothetical protein [Pseudomonadota bacterium]
MQLEDSAGDVEKAAELAEYVLAMSLQLAAMTRRAGLKGLAGSLEETHRAACAALATLQAGNAAPDDAA